MFKKVDHLEIVPGDLERVIEFYTDILGFHVKQRKNVEAAPIREVVYLELNDNVVEFLSVDGPAPKSQEQWQVGYRMMALEVDDMDEAVEYLKGKGVEITWGPVDLGESKRAEIKDPDGLSIELRQW
jgi:glyoxylase I family protein